MADTVKHTDDGGFAYPSTPDADVCGMTLRDWFAGQSLAGMFNHIGWIATHDDDQSEVAKRAYAIADGMIAARKAGA